MSPHVEKALSMFGDNPEALRQAEAEAQDMTNYSHELGLDEEILPQDILDAWGEPTSDISEYEEYLLMTGRDV